MAILIYDPEADPRVPEFEFDIIMALPPRLRTLRLSYELEPLADEEPADGVA